MGHSKIQMTSTPRLHTLSKMKFKTQAAAECYMQPLTIVRYHFIVFDVTFCLDSYRVFSHKH